jgi:hypothetical protein
MVGAEMAVAPTEACAPSPDGWLSERHAHLHWKNREHMPCLGFDRNYSACSTVPYLDPTAQTLVF